MPYMFFSRPNQRHSTPADSLTKGIGFNNTYSLNNTTNITYGSSYSSTVFNVKANNREDNVTMMLIMISIQQTLAIILLFQILI